MRNLLKPVKSKRTLALVVAAILLFAGSGYMFAKAQLNIQSQEYEGHFELDHLAVALVENGNMTAAQDEQLLQYLDNKIQPGAVYKEEISAINTSDVDQYLRLTIRKYWLDKDGEKDASKDPGLIKLYYNKEGSYNKGPWQINDDETTTERTVYYYSSIVKKNAATEPVVNKLKVDGSVLDDLKTETEQTEGGTIYRYIYNYDGYSICVEADVQALQTHNVNDAIKGIWGVQNVSVSGTTLTVK